MTASRKKKVPNSCVPTYRAWRKAWVGSTASQQKSGTGGRVRSFTGDGNRQYLTGMQMGGKRVVILVDASASMLARTYVNVVRYRAMPDERKRKAPKWRQVVAAVDGRRS